VVKVTTDKTNKQTNKQKNKKATKKNKKTKTNKLPTNNISGQVLEN